jgi:hypothetical protein
MTGNRYPRTAKEKAAVGPDVKKFIQNMDKQGAQGGKSEEKTGKVNITGKQIATGALGVGLVAGAVAAARRQGTRDAVTTFLRNLGDKPRTKTYTRPNQGDITPPPVQQQTAAGPRMAGQQTSTPVSTPNYMTPSGKPEQLSLLLGQSSRIPTRQQGPMPPKIGLSEYEDIEPGSFADMYPNPQAEDQEEIVREHAQLKGLGFAREFGGYPSRDPVSGYLLSDIQKKLEDIRTEPERENAFRDLFGDNLDRMAGKNTTPAPSQLVLNYKPPAPSGKPAPGTILGRDLSPAEKEKALARAKLQEFNAERYGVNKSGVRAARYEIEKQKSQINQPVVASQPSAENDEFYTRDELNTMGKIDKLVASIKTGARPQQPKAVATDVKNTALLQSADNKTPKVNKIIGEPTLKSKHDTKMAVHEETRVANTINEYKGEFDSTYGKVLNQLTQGNVSGASDRDKRRAERLTNKVLNKNNPGLVNRFHAAVKQDVSMKTEVNPEDASRIAESVIDPTTGTRQFDQETSTTVKREPFKETTIKGEPKSGGGRKVSAYGPGYASKSTIGVYGLERANYPEADPTKKPTEVTKERAPLIDRKAGGITTKQDIRGLKDAPLDRVIDQGTFKSGKQSSTAKLAQEEKERRQTRAKLGSDFPFEAMRGLQNIERNVAPDQRPDARKKYLEELRQERNLRSRISDVMD